MIYDTLNHMTFLWAIGKMEQSETGMLWKALAEMDLQRRHLLIFDRYYAAHLLFFYLHKTGVQFCFRMKSNWWKVVEVVRTAM